MWGLNLESKRLAYARHTQIQTRARLLTKDKLVTEQELMPVALRPHLYGLGYSRQPSPSYPGRGVGTQFYIFYIRFYNHKFLADLIFPHFSRLSDFSLIEKELLRASYLT